MTCPGTLRSHPVLTSFVAGVGFEVCRGEAELASCSTCSMSCGSALRIVMSDRNEHQRRRMMRAPLGCTRYMALRGKDLQQEIVLPGTPENLMQVVEQALRAGGFTKIEADAEAAMCKGNYHKGTIWGELRIELDDDSPGHTRLHLRASAAKDNIWTALRGDPNERIIDRFTRCLPPPSPNTPSTQAPPASVASELERLAVLRKQGVLSAEEFEAANPRCKADHAQSPRLRHRHRWPRPPGRRHIARDHWRPVAEAAADELTSRLDSALGDYIGPVPAPLAVLASMMILAFIVLSASLAARLLRSSGKHWPTTAVEAI